MNKRKRGRVRLIAIVLKTIEPEMVPWVRIPPLPPVFIILFRQTNDEMRRQDEISYVGTDSNLDVGSLADKTGARSLSPWFESKSAVLQ